jgi:hypothetical protein
MDDKPSIGGPASATAIKGLVLNVVMPGLGSILYGNTQQGAGMLALAVLGIPVLFWHIVLGILMMLGAWGWSIVAGVQMLSSDAS